MADCLNREIIMAAPSSEATEQPVTAAKTSLYQIQAILAAQFEEGASRLRDVRFKYFCIPFVSAKQSGIAIHSRMRRVLSQPRDTASDGHSYAQTAIRGNLKHHDEF